MEIIAWIGSFLLASCGIPQAIACFKTKSAKGVSGAMLLMWGLGDFLLLVYSFFYLKDTALIFNYGVNFLLVLVIINYKINDIAKDLA